MGPSEKKDVETENDKDKVENPTEKQKIPPKEITSSKLKDSRLSEKTPLGFGSKETTTLSTETRYPKEILPLSTETRDPKETLPLST